MKEKKIEEQNEIQMPISINISKSSTEIDYSDIKIEQGECFLNSYRIAKKYPSVEIVEGLIIAIDDDNGAKALPHVWNKKDEFYFDITEEKVWNGREEMNETKEIKYFSVKIHNHSDFKNGDIFEFSFDTNENVTAINDVLNKNDEEIEENLGE